MQNLMPGSDPIHDAHLLPKAIGGASLSAWQPPAIEDVQLALPQYEMLEILGRGGMGAVYKARQKSLRRTVAVKILSAGQVDVEMRFAERFKTEAYAMARLNHPNIVNVHDTGETEDGLLYFVMEHVEGRDLAQVIARRGQLPQAEVKAAALQVVEALAYAHANGIIHRDIKPANILLDAQGRVKVADFGLAKLEEPMVSTLLTKSGTSMGTADFMAPETRQPGSAVDARADLFSLGVTIYQMLTGELPRGMFKLPSELRQDIDPHWDEIICKSLEPTPDDRYQTATEMRGDLERISLDGSASPAPKPDSSQAAPAAQPVRKTFISGWLMIAFVVAAALGVSALWITNKTQPSSEVERMAWTDWLGPKLADPKNFIDKGWLREEGGLSTERALSGTTISPLRIADGAVRVRYLIRDSNGVQITVRDCGMGGQERRLYVAHDTGVSVYIGRMDIGGKVRALANKPYPAEIDRDAERTLEFRCVGTSLTVSLNGVPIVAADDATLQEGPCAIVLNRGVLVKGVEFAVLKEGQPDAAASLHPRLPPP